MQHDLFKSVTVVDIVRGNADFPEDFAEWLPENVHVWEAFRDEAIAIRNRSFQHYSSATIIQVLRHHSAIREQGGQWKINNNHSPYLARLFDLMHPECAGLFEYREVKKETA